MMNPDQQLKVQSELKAKISQAIEDGNTEDFSQLLTDYMARIEQEVIKEAKNSSATVMNDSNVLQTRGVRQLTSEETNYYQSVIGAMQAAPNSLSDIDVVMPETIIDAVFDDLSTGHELLSVIGFENITGLTSMLMNTHEKQLATWGPLNSEIVKELVSGFEEIQLGQNKLSAFMMVSQDMLDLGPVWIDRYVREVMYEALAYGLEDGIINGTGKDQPIGMTKDLDEAVDPVTGYADKAATVVTELDAEAYGAILAELSENAKGHKRTVNNVIMVVNPTDYFTKVMPATTQLINGTWVNNILPYPTRIIQSTEVADGQAVIGLADEYTMGMGLVKDGKIEYSDEYKFLEDYRTYKIRFLGEGRPKDNTAFKVLDISGLKPLTQKVEVVSDTPAV